MSAEMVTPTDERTQLPLPIIQHRPYLPDKASGETDEHHAIHPRLNPILTSSLGGKALRHSRTQLLEKTDHNVGPRAYHLYFAGPAIPSDETAQLRMVIPAVAGYVPPEGIDMTDNGPVVRAMTKQEYQWLRAPERTNSRQAAFEYHHFRYRYEPVREFLTDYVLRHGIDMNDRLVDQFLSARKYEQRQRIGQTLLARAAEVASEPLVPQYRELKKEGRLHRRMPADPQTLMFNSIGAPQTNHRVLQKIETWLLAAA